MNLLDRILKKSRNGEGLRNNLKKLSEIFEEERVAQLTAADLSVIRGDLQNDIAEDVRVHHPVIWNAVENHVQDVWKTRAIVADVLVAIMRSDK